MHGGLFEQSGPVHHRPAFWIVGTIIEPRDPGMGNCARTHRAGFERYPKVAANEAIIAEKRCRFAQGNNFSMRSRVTAFEWPVRAASDYLAVFHDNRANGHLACGTGYSGEGERLFHHFAGFGQRHRASLAETRSIGYTAG